MSAEEAARYHPAEKASRLTDHPIAHGCARCLEAESFVGEYNRTRSALAGLVEAAEKVEATIEYSAGEGCIGCGIAPPNHYDDCWYVALREATTQARDVLGGQR